MRFTYKVYLIIMRGYKKLIKKTIISFLIGGLFIFWGYQNDGILRIVIGSLILVNYTKKGIENFKFIRELKLWMRENNGRLVFFYPIKKEVQLEVEKHILPLLPLDVLKVKYDGPNLVGDIKLSVTIELMNQYEEIKVNSPSLFKIIGNKIRIISLSELKDFDTTSLNLSSIKNKIDEIIKIEQ